MLVTMRARAEGEPLSSACAPGARELAADLDAAEAAAGGAPIAWFAPTNDARWLRNQSALRRFGLQTLQVRQLAGRAPG